MAMFAPIPLPDRNKTFQDVMDYLENVQRRRAQQQQFSVEQQRLQQQFAKEFGLKQKAEERAEQLFPSTLEKQKAELEDTKVMNEFMKHLKRGGKINDFKPTPKSKLENTENENNFANNNEKLVQSDLQSPTPNISNNSSETPETQVQNNSNEAPSQYSKLADFIAARKKIPIESHIVGGYRVTHNPLTGETTKEKVGQTPFEEELSKSDVKKINDWENTAELNIQSRPNFDSLSQITSSDEFRNMHNHPIAPGLELSYYKINGTPAQKELIGKYETFANDIILNSIKQFGSRFTNQDLNFLTKMKISNSDTLESAQGKLQALMYMRELAGKRAELAAKIARTGVAPLEAFKQANEQLDGDKIREEIERKVTGRHPKITKKHITEENIEHTMKEMNLSRAEVMQRLKAKGLM